MNEGKPNLPLLIVVIIILVLVLTSCSSNSPAFTFVGKGDGNPVIELGQVKLDGAYHINTLTSDDAYITAQRESGDCHITNDADTGNILISAASSCVASLTLVVIDTADESFWYRITVDKTN